MTILITKELAVEVANKFRFVGQYENKLKNYFLNKHYGLDLDVIYISILCMSPRFEMFFKPRRTSYKKDSTTKKVHGTEVVREAKSLVYDLRLDFEKYFQASEIKQLLAEDVLNSLQVIGTVKQIKDFDLESFRADMKAFFELNGWLI